MSLESAARIRSLIDAANAVTGNGDTDLTAAVSALAAGFGQGGGSGWTYDMGEFVLDADVTASYSTSSPIPHNLGAVPDFVLVWTDDLTGTAASTDYADNLGYVFLRQLMNLPQRLSSAANSAPEKAVGVNFARTKNFTTEAVSVNAPSSYVYLPAENNLPTAEGFGLGYTSPNNRWRGGITYRYFAAQAWWNIEEATA